MLGENAVSLTTTGTLDGTMVMSEPHRQDCQEYSAVGMCTPSTLKDVLLDPPRSGTKRQAALAMITAAASERMLVLQMVQLLTEGEFQAITPTMQKLQALCRRTRFSDSCGNPDWSQPDTGVFASEKKCRRLGRNPTGDDLPASFVNIASGESTGQTAKD